MPLLKKKKNSKSLTKITKSICWILDNQNIYQIVLNYILTFPIIQIGFSDSRPVGIPTSWPWNFIRIHRKQFLGRSLRDAPVMIAKCCKLNIYHNIEYVAWIFVRTSQLWRLHKNAVIEKCRYWEIKKLVKFFMIKPSQSFFCRYWEVPLLPRKQCS